MYCWEPFLFGVLAMKDQCDLGGVIRGEKGMSNYNPRKTIGCPSIITVTLLRKIVVSHRFF